MPVGKMVSPETLKLMILFQTARGERAVGKMTTGLLFERKLAGREKAQEEHYGIEWIPLHALKKRKI